MQNPNTDNKPGDASKKSDPEKRSDQGNGPQKQQDNKKDEKR
tara:strand:+ start:271 stop:396 length:126 start_codon:yes stop_codon:yes gene_type:complete